MADSEDAKPALVVCDNTRPVCNDNKNGLQYNLEKRPPVSVIIFSALQHILLTLVSFVLTPLIISDIICAESDDPVRTALSSSTMFMSGISTVLMTLIGVRLPILQGPASGFIIVLLAVRNTDEWKCTEPTTVNTTSVNSTETGVGILSQTERLQQLSGTVMVGSLVEIIIGGTGLVGKLLRFVGPITVAPTITVIGLSLYNITIQYSKPSWELAVVGALLMLVFAMYIDHVNVPLPTAQNCKRSNGGERRGLKIFQLFPVLFSMIIVWCVSAILTYTDVFPYDPNNPHFTARVDAKAKLIDSSPWFYFPYPGQFGTPSFNVGIFIGFITAYVASIIESVGDYFAAAKACHVATPPEHAVNRGILVEGIGGLLSGAFGIGHATTSYTHNIAAMTLTRTANRYVLACAGGILVVMSFFGKFGAVLATIPEPALGGVLITLCGLLVAMGLSTLQHVNLNSSRNLLIVGLAIFVGIFVPQWVERFPDYFKTGNREADSIILVVLGTPMFLSGVLALILDNTARGSRKDRGIDAWRTGGVSGISSDCEMENSETTDQSTYGWSLQNRLYRVVPCFSKLPFMPPFDDSESYELPNV